MENLTFMGVPSFASQPHFLHGDDILVSSVEGLNPEEAVHQTWLDIDAYTGLTARYSYFSNLL
jgi:hypothetical protein